MKRLQFRHHEGVFETRQLALEYFASIADVNNMASVEFGDTLYAEPLVAKYLDDENNIQLLFAVGVDGEHTPYHIIDSAEIVKNIAANADAIAGEIARATESENSLSEAIENLQEEVSGNVSTIVSVDPSSANVLEEYALKNAKGETLGEHIKIYKESSLVEVQLGYQGAYLLRDSSGDYYKNPDGTYKLFYDDPQPTGDKQYLYLIYRCEDESLNLIGVDLEQFITENEYGDGLQKNGKVISVKIDTTSEVFLTVSASGVKLSGVQTAIDAAKAQANAYTDNAVDTEKVAREEEEAAIRQEIAAAVSGCNAQTMSAYTMATAYTHESVDALSAQTESAISRLSANTETAIENASNSAYEKAVASAETYTNNLYIAKLDMGSGSTLIAKYQLQFGEQFEPNHNKGAVIEIPRATSLKEVTMGYVNDYVNPHTGDITHVSGATAIDIVYMGQDGVYHLTTLPTADILTDIAFGDGLATEGGIISIQTPPNEEYLVVGKDTVGTSGITSAIRTSTEMCYSAVTTETNVKIEQLRDSVNTRLDNDEANITNLNDNLQELGTEVVSLSTAVANLGMLVEGIPALSAATELNTMKINELSASVITNYATSADTVNAINAVNTALTERIDSVNSALTNSINALSGHVVDEISTKVSGLNTSINSLRSDVESADTAINGRIDTLAGEVSAISANVINIFNRLDGIDTALQEINDKLASTGLVQTLMSVLSGTPTEIKVTSTGDKVVIGFTDDAIFGEE